MKEHSKKIKIDYTTEFICPNCQKKRTGYRRMKDSMCAYCLYVNWKKNNPEKIKATQLRNGRRYRSEHHEEYKEYQKIYHRKYYHEHKSKNEQKALSETTLNKS